MSLRVLVVDDTVLYRRLISEVLSEIEGVEVVASAGGGRMGLAKIESLHPDVVTLDIEMPDMDGLQVLQEMQRRRLDVGVIVLSAVTVRGGEMTIRALQHGAFDFVTKPSGGSPEDNRRSLTNTLRPILRAIANRKPRAGRPPDAAAGPSPSTTARSERGPIPLGSAAPPEPGTPVPPGAPGAPGGPGTSAGPNTIAGPAGPKQIVELPSPRRVAAPGGPLLRPPPGIATPPSGPVSMRGLRRPSGLPAANLAATSALEDVSRRMERVARAGRPEMVLIGVSTGGPNALAQMLPRLPADLGVPVLVVQHMPPIFTRSLAESLATRCALGVKEAEPGEIARPGWIHIAPGGRQMKVAAAAGGEIRLEVTDDPPENNCRPSVDYLFRSASAAFPGRSVAVIMTGMGNDGTAGMKLLKRGGVLTIAQDEASCVVYGMPREAVAAGVVDLVLPLAEIADGIHRAVRGLAA